MTTQGYNKTSIIYHWVAAIIFACLYATGDDDEGLIFIFHVSFGAIAGLFLFWRVGRRIVRGMPDKTPQAEILNRLSAIVIWGFLGTMIAVVASGFLMFWLAEKPVEIFGMISIPSPLGANAFMADIMEEIHELLANTIFFLVILHVAGALKHLIIDRDGVTSRMFKSVKGGF